MAIHTRVKFNNKPPTLDEVNSVVKKAIGKFSPGPNKRCPNLPRWLFEILQSAWNNLINDLWMSVEGVNITEEQNLTEISYDQSNCSMALRRTKRLAENGYVNVSVPKGGLPEVSGCNERTTVICEATQGLNRENAI
ncbi:reverse transcriptase [Plakobranchus ocellatus]|uniref:Reverse transcriptase n=1 Tax=Plakobranchus ocellatus TaxID=259542 RepID=A0AAV3YFH0_9GAST|nr:reverse transcriptase [Plakobranchus ocellatus]